MPERWEERWKASGPIAPGLTRSFLGLLTVGLGAFLVGLFLDPTRAWQIYLVNFLFWGGLAQGAVVFAAIYHVVGAKWGLSLRRLAEGMAVFLPVNLFLFFPLYFGLDLFFGEIQALNPNRGAWFDPRFIFVRGGLGLTCMTVLSLLFVYHSLRPGVGLALDRGFRPRLGVYRWLTKEWQGEQVEVQRSERGLDLLAAGVLIAYPITYSFMAFDLIMALDPFWYSSLFGAYMMVSAFYLGLAGLAVVVVLCQWYFEMPPITTAQLSDLGKLLLGFNLLYAAMLWSQYVVIWYGNLPEETHFVVLRLWEKPWSLLSWTALSAAIFIPFLIFLSRRAKETPAIMLPVGALIAAGLWLERYVLVVPSLTHATAAPFGWLEIGVTLGFLGAAGLSYVLFLQYLPMLPAVKAPVGRPSSH